MILIHGRGLTALICARLLANRDIEARLCGEPRPSDLVLLIGSATLELISEIFGDPGIRSLGFPVERRIVRWAGHDPQAVSAPARSIELDALVSRLASGSDAPRLDPSRGARGVRCQVDATGRRAELARGLTGMRPTEFGQRQMLAARSAGSTEQAVMEATRRGWIFMFPVARDEIVVQAMCHRRPPEPLAHLRQEVDATTIIREHIDGADIHRCACIPAAPAIFPVIGSDRWLAVGHSAVAVDPLCGDGVGVAVHSALLAAAAIEKIGSPDHSALIDHYQKRHQRSFATHLRHVADYYAPLAEDPEWADELKSTHRFLRSPLAPTKLSDASLSYRLCGSELTQRR